MTETITAAAIRCNMSGHVYTLPPPARHHTILLHWRAELAIEREQWRAREMPLTVVHLRNAEPDIILTRPHVQGFVTSDGRFVDRIEAAAIALANGQVSKLRSPPNLYSEDLW